MSLGTTTLQPLIVAVSSSAIFKQDFEDAIYKSDPAEYAKYQEENVDTPLEKGPAFSFVARLLDLNDSLGRQVVDVVVLSRNSALTGRRIFSSIQHYGLGIERAIFTDGYAPHTFLSALGSHLYLSPNEPDVREALAMGNPAGLIVDNEHQEHQKGRSLRVAFDFDGVISDDGSERVYAESGIEAFHQHETLKKDVPHDLGPLAALLSKLAEIREIEESFALGNPDYTVAIKICIVTARSRDGFDRAVTTLKMLGVPVDFAAFLAGTSKEPILDALRPIIFFDDQSRHLSASSDKTSLIHIPFGVRN
ncbi:hypothetical protein A6E01_20830 (plasmid) [Vibrio breoganii]|uniref:5'-nucleotidase n=1 Tax=Vibrio breoganii TaxID=553239 RepID=A0AAN1CV74_9VIBR|nr:5'-nucleotidase [Vibrio breoganii]ANO35659.1 hypothetical protein A6E01_20830 [Vibrio breoganii]